MEWNLKKKNWIPKLISDETEGPIRHSQALKQSDDQRQNWDLFIQQVSRHMYACIWVITRSERKQQNRWTEKEKGQPLTKRQATTAHVRSKWHKKLQNPRENSNKIKFWHRPTALTVIAKKPEICFLKKEKERKVERERERERVREKGSRAGGGVPAGSVPTFLNLLQIENRSSNVTINNSFIYITNQSRLLLTN